MKNADSLNWIVLLFAALAMAACGGGAETPTTEPEEPEASTAVADPAPPPTDDIIFDPTSTTNTTLWSWGTQGAIADANLNGTLTLPAFAHLAPNPNPNNDPNKKFRIVWNDGTADTPISSFTVPLTGGNLTVTQSSGSYAFTMPNRTENSPPYPGGMNWPADLTSGLGATFSYTPVGQSPVNGAQTSKISKIRMPLADSP